MPSFVEMPACNPDRRVRRHDRRARCVRQTGVTSMPSFVEIRVEIIEISRQKILNPVEIRMHDLDCDPDRAQKLISSSLA